MKQKILNTVGAVVICYESYILPWTSVAVVFGIVSEIFVNRGKIQLLLSAFSRGELQPSQTFLFLHVVFLVAMIIYNSSFALGLLVRKKITQKFETFREILLPLATCFYYYLFNFSVFLPLETNIVLIPDFLHGFSTVLGMAMMVVGFLISAVGTCNLGNSFAVFVEARGLVTTNGLYQFTRHPIYLGHFIRTVGMCFAVCFLFQVALNVRF